MASAVSQTQPFSAGDGYEDYLPDDLSDFGELFSESEQPKDKSGSTQAKAGDATAGLGIDKAVDIQKRVREPRVKLDESKLLSSKGIPELRKRARNLKLKGKGHEFSDASRLLSMYQLWLDDLFPKARFADALTMVEKEGHKASMNKMRMDWINEWKPRDDTNGDVDEADADMLGGSLEPPTKSQQGNPQEDAFPNAEDIFEDLYNASPVRPMRPPQQEADEVPDEDELDALMEEAMGIHEPVQASRPMNLVAADENSMEMDDLDALMAEAEAAA